MKKPAVAEREEGIYSLMKFGGKSSIRHPDKKVLSQPVEGGQEGDVKNSLKKKGFNGEGSPRGEREKGLPIQRKGREEEK